MMKRLALLAVLVFAAVPATAQDDHEYAPIEEKTINYKDWTLKGLDGGESVNLRKWAEGKKLVLVVYYAPWCGNWHYEAPIVARLREKYRQHGFEVVAVNEYGTVAMAKEFMAKSGGGYPVVVESEGEDARDKTTHYGYRTATGDQRTWGSPYNVFLEPAKLSKSGEVLTEKAWIANGELVEADAERFVRERLGLKPEKQ